MSDFEPIVGRYLAVDIEGAPHRVHVEEAGQGVPLLCLHTAGADSRQYRHVLNDAEITDRFRVIAFDLPYHGRSTPADGWWLKKYRLTTQSYLAMIRAVWLKLGLEKPVVMGCSMGGAIVLKVAAEYQEELTGIVGLESSAYAPGRYNELLHHPAIHGGELAASYTYGLNSPNSPEANRRENWWYYSQGGPGVYQGDVHVLLERLGRARGHQAHRHQPLQGRAADRRVRLFLHAGDERGGRGRDSRLAAHHHEGHGTFPDGGELSGVPAVSVAGARARGGVVSRDSAALPSPCGEGVAMRVEQG